MTLFQPDFFSRSQPVYSEISSPRYRTLLSKIPSYYHLDSPLEFSCKSFGELGVNSKNFLFTCPSLSFTAKLLPENSYLDHRNTCEFISSLNSPHLPSPIISNTHSYALKLDNFTVSLWHHIPGPYFSGSLNNLESISYVLLGLFSSLRSTSLNPPLPPPNFSLVDIYNVLENFFIATSLLDLPHTIIDTFNPHQAELTCRHLQHFFLIFLYHKLHILFILIFIHIIFFSHQTSFQN